MPASKASKVAVPEQTIAALAFFNTSALCTCSQAMFLWFCKWFSYYCLFILLVLASCNFGVDGTGGKSNGELHEEYKERMGLK